MIKTLAQTLLSVLASATAGEDGTELDDVVDAARELANAVLEQPEVLVGRWWDVVADTEVSLPTTFTRFGRHMDVGPVVFAEHAGRESAFRPTCPRAEAQFARIRANTEGRL